MYLCAIRLTSKLYRKYANYLNSYKIMKITSTLKMRRLFSNMKMKFILLI